VDKTGVIRVNGFAAAVCTASQNALLADYVSDIHAKEAFFAVVESIPQKR
jgi:hypothetical protein